MYITTIAMPLDVVRHENDVTLRLDVPGMDRDQIEVTVDRGILTISGKRNEERTENDKFFVRERRMGTFTRRMRLPENLNADAVEASYDKGVLEVRIPVLEQAKARKIEVRSARRTTSRSSPPDLTQPGSAEHTSGRRARMRPAGRLPSGQREERHGIVTARGRERPAVHGRAGRGDARRQAGLPAPGGRAAGGLAAAVGRRPAPLHAL